MAGKFSQIEAQVQTQAQTLTPQQLLVSQLTEMLALPAEDRELISPDTKREDIRELKRLEKMPEEQSDFVDRFVAATLGFTIEPDTSDAILRQRKLLSDIAGERIREELLKLLCGDHAAFVLRRYRSVIAVFIPELKGTFDFEQNSKHHNRDVYRHTVAAVHNIEPLPLLRVTMLFHDIGKPLAQTTDKYGMSHYKNHPKIGAAMTREILRRLCMSSAFIDEVCTLIRWHDERFVPDAVMLKGYLKRLGVETMQALMLIQHADILAQSKYMREEKLRTLSAVSDELNRIIAAGECYSLRQLAVNGSDLIHIGVSSGVRIGKTLDLLLDKVIAGELPNEKEALLAYAKSTIDKEE